MYIVKDGLLTRHNVPLLDLLVVELGLEFLDIGHLTNGLHKVVLDTVITVLVDSKHTSLSGHSLLDISLHL